MLSLDQIGSKVDNASGKVDTANGKLDALQLAAEKRTAISSLPYTISSPGSYYVTANLTPPSGQGGITISASDVTLDLNGFSLTGTGAAAAANAILINDTLKNIHVHGGGIRNWPGKAISAGTNTSTTVYEDLRIHSCATGGIASGNNCSVRRCQVVSCTGGPGVSVGIYSDVDQVSCDHNGRGIVGTQLATVSRCLVTYSTGNGIDFGPRVSVLDCILNSNSGASINTSGNSLIANCTVETSAIAGVNAGSASTVQGCTIISQGSDNIIAGGDCLVLHNLCAGNGPGSSAVGIHTTFGANRIQDNHIISVGKGILLTGSSNITVGNSITSSSAPFPPIPPGNFTGTQVTTESAMNSAANSLVNVVMP